MPFPLKAVLSRHLVGAFAVFASVGCSLRRPGSETHHNILPADSHSAQLDSLVSPIPRTPIPCGRVRGLVIDDDSVRVLGNLQVQFVSASGRVSVRSSSRRYFELQPRDTTGMVVRVMRKDSLLLDLPLSQMQFGKAFGHRLAVMLSEKGSRVVMESSSCMG